jgi:hypothetical protein
MAWQPPSRQSWSGAVVRSNRTQRVAQLRSNDTPASRLPLGFLAVDLARALGLPLIDHESNFATIGEGAHARSETR